MHRLLTVMLVLLATIPARAQQTSKEFQLSEKFYLYWGWNRGWYSKSDVHLFGSDHDFVLHDAEARDLQSDFSFRKYFYITSLSVPQTNIKLGYYLNDKYSFAVGFDHMKYKLVQDQVTTITGSIDRPGSKYSGTYNGEDLVLDEHFLTYDHTDGLNYVFVEGNRHDQLFESTGGKFVLSAETGVGLALLRPRTAVRFLDVKGPNVYHNAGYGLNGKVGLNLRVFKHVSIMSELKAGYINMPHIRATANKEGEAEQHFWFLQSNLLLGATFGLW